MAREDLQWLVINDFSAGIQNKVMNATGTVPGAAGTSTPARLGTAVEDDTYRCIALPTGGLGPLPGRTFAHYRPSLVPPANAAFGHVRIVGFHLTGPVLDVGEAGETTAVIYQAYEWVDTTTDTRHFRVIRFGMWDDPPIETIIYTWNGTPPSQGPVYRGCWFTDYRANPGDPTIAGTPIISFAWFEGAGGGKEVWVAYPDPANPGVDATVDIATQLSVDGLAGHQGRLVALEGRVDIHGGGGSAQWGSNERAWFTKVNSLTLHSDQAAIFGYERQCGYGSIGSVSTDEFLMVKHRGGGLTVNGDLENPTVVWLPGLVSTSGIMVEGVYSPIGWVYGVQDGGVYVWAGGDAAEKISAVLEDGFWIHPGWMANINQYRGQMMVWDDWIVTPRNWLYDTQGQGWWRLDNPDEVDCYLWQRDVVWNYLWGAPYAYSTATDPIFYKWRKRTPAHSYSWKSQPLPQSMFRTIQAREVVLVAQGVGTVVITLHDENGATRVETFTIDSHTTPRALRATTSHRHLNHVQVQIQATGDAAEPTSPAPLVYEVRIGWREASRLANEPQA